VGSVREGGGLWEEGIHWGEVVEERDLTKVCVNEEKRRENVA
jgi:hypothetical protein